jgi:hypothetical protein
MSALTAKPGKVGIGSRLLSNFASAAPSSSGPIRCRRTRCCSTRILMRFVCSAACRGAVFTTTCVRPWIGSALAKSARSTHALPLWPRTTCSTRIFAIRLRAGLAEVRHWSEHRRRGAGREERSGRTPPALAGDAALCHAYRAERLARPAMSGAMARDAARQPRRIGIRCLGGRGSKPDAARLVVRWICRVRQTRLAKPALNRAFFGGWRAVLRPGPHIGAPSQAAEYEFLHRTIDPQFEAARPPRGAYDRVWH